MSEDRMTRLAVLDLAVMLNDLARIVNREVGRYENAELDRLHRRVSELADAISRDLFPDGVPE